MIVYGVVGACILLLVATFVLGFPRAWRSGATPRPSEPPRANVGPRRDVPVAEVLAYLADAQSSGDDRLEMAAREMRQAAFDGDVPVWGRRMPPCFDGLSAEDRPLLRIEPAYWEAHAIEVLAFLEPAWDGAQTAGHGESDREFYRDLWTSRADVGRKWPQPAGG